MEASSKYTKIKNGIITVCLIAASAGAAFAITRSDNMGLVFICLMIGIAVTVAAVRNTFIGLLAVVSIGFVFADISRFTHGVIPFGLLIDILMALVFVGLVIHKRGKGENMWQYMRHPIVYGYLAIIIYTFAQVINPNGYGPAQTIVILRRFVVLQMYLYCCIQVFDIDTFKKFLRYFMIAATLAAIIGCYQEWVGYPKYELDYINSDPKMVALYASDVGGGFRKFSTLTDPTAFGILMSIMATLNIVVLVTSKFNFTRVTVLGVSTVLLMMSMGYSGTRTAVAALAGGVAMYILMTLQNPKTLAFAAVAFVGFVVIIYGPIYGNPTINRMRSTFEFGQDKSMDVRNVNRHRIQPYLQGHPFGGGLGTTGGSPGEVSLTSSFRHPLAGFPSDSGFLKMGLEFGWIGLIVQLIAFFIVLHQGAKAYFASKNPEYKRMYLMAVVVLFCFMLAHYAQVAIGAVPSAFLFYAMVAGIIKLRQIEPSTSSNLKPI